MLPQPDEYPGFNPAYVAHVSHYATVQETLHQTTGPFQEILDAITEEEGLYAYAPGKWTLKEMVQHITDTERIMAYRALCIARGDKTPFPVFQHPDYAAASGANNRSWKAITEEWTGHRQSAIQLFDGLTDEQLLQYGTVSKYSATANGLGYVIAGHSIYHIEMIKERYLNKAYANTVG